MRKLIPCPFCGGKWKIERNLKHGLQRATCQTCGVEIEETLLKDLIAAVNRRPD